MGRTAALCCVPVASLLAARLTSQWCQPASASHSAHVGVRPRAALDGLAAWLVNRSTSLNGSVTGQETRALVLGYLSARSHACLATWIRLAG